MLNKPLRKIRASRAKRELAIFSEAPPNLAQISSKFAEIAQLVEHDLAKVGVASSSLVFRSKQKTGFCLSFCFCTRLELATRPPRGQPPQAAGGNVKCREGRRPMPALAGSSLVFRSKSTSAIAGVLFSRKTLDCAKFFLLTPVLRTSPVREYRLRFRRATPLLRLLCDDVHEIGRKVGVFHASATDFVHFSSHSKIVWRKTTDFWAKTVNFSSIWPNIKL